MEFLELMQWLIEECHRHNGSYHHVTDKAKLAYAEQVLKTCFAIFGGAHPSQEKASGEQEPKKA